MFRISENPEFLQSVGTLWAPSPPTLNPKPRTLMRDTGMRYITITMWDLRKSLVSAAYIYAKPEP